jgi:hypothetical protein
MWLPLQLALSLLSALPTVGHADSCQAAIAGRPVPAEFVGDRVFVRWTVRGRGTLSLYTDTGGGLLALYPEAVRRLGLRSDTTAWTRGAYHGTVITVKVPRDLGDSDLPSIPGSDSAAVDFLVQNTEPPPQDETGHLWDGRLGSMWFADRVWVFDYPDQRLYFSSASPVGPSSPGCWTPLGFQTDSAGRRTNSFPRITARVDGETMQFLLDTGARTTLTDGAWRALGDAGPRHRAASFITKERFDGWHARHPEWTVIPDAEERDSLPMIRVPVLEVDGRGIGPVWFTERPDRSFKEFMSRYMDQPIEGALGGSAWRHVTLIVDYPRARAAVLASSDR